MHFACYDSLFVFCEGMRVKVIMNSDSFDKIISTNVVTKVIT